MDQEFQTLLEAHWEGRLDAEGRERLEALCARSPELARTWEAEQRMDAMLGQCGPNRAPAGLSARVLGEAPDAVGERRSESRGWGLPLMLRWGMAIAVVALISVEVAILTKGDSPETTGTPRQMAMTLPKLDEPPAVDRAERLTLSEEAAPPADPQREVAMAPVGILAGSSRPAPEPPATPAPSAPPIPRELIDGVVRSIGGTSDVVADAAATTPQNDPPEAEPPSTREVPLPPGGGTAVTMALDSETEPPAAAAMSDAPPVTPPDAGMTAAAKAEEGGVTANPPVESPDEASGTYDPNQPRQLALLVVLPATAAASPIVSAPPAAPRTTAPPPRNGLGEAIGTLVTGLSQATSPGAAPEVGRTGFSASPATSRSSESRAVEASTADSAALEVRAPQTPQARGGSPAVTYDQLRAALEQNGGRIVREMPLTEPAGFVELRARIASGRVPGFVERLTAMGLQAQHEKAPDISEAVANTTGAAMVRSDWISGLRPGAATEARTVAVEQLKRRAAVATPGGAYHVLPTANAPVIALPTAGSAAAAAPAASGTGQARTSQPSAPAGAPIELIIYVRQP